MSELPFAVPRSQLWYWSPQWQRDEAEAIAELERGESRTFANAAEAIEWLMADEVTDGPAASALKDKSDAEETSDE